MTTTKSDKELAFLHDLYVATDWGERFAELVDEHVELPKKGRLLYVASGTGGHALALAERAGDRLEVVCVDEYEECLELGRTKAIAVRAEPEFRRAQLEALGFEDDQFDLVICDGSLIDVERLPEVIAELARVTAPDGTMALTLATASSFGEFFSVYWEALRNTGDTDHEREVESLIIERPTATAIETIATEEGLENVTSWTQIEEFDFESGKEFLNAPLISDFLLRGWLDSLPEDADRGRVLKEIVRIIDAERQDMDFALTVKATLVVGHKLS